MMTMMDFFSLDSDFWALTLFVVGGNSITAQRMIQADYVQELVQLGLVRHHHSTSATQIRNRPGSPRGQGAGGGGCDRVKVTQ